MVANPRRLVFHDDAVLVVIPNFVRVHVDTGRCQGAGVLIPMRAAAIRSNIRFLLWLLARSDQ